MEKAILALKAGGVILHKTDTVWGLACDARNEAAVQKMKDLKGRPDDKGFILLINNISDLSVYVENVPDLAWDLIEFAEKPLTVVYEKGKNLPENVKATDGSIAIRLVKDEACQQLLYKFGRAIASTSANIAGEKTPQKYNEIDEKIIEKVDYTLMNIGPDEALPPSTIVKLGANGDFSFIRK